MAVGYQTGPFGQFGHQDPVRIGRFTKLLLEQRHRFRVPGYLQIVGPGHRLPGPVIRGGSDTTEGKAVVTPLPYQPEVVFQQVGIITKHRDPAYFNIDPAKVVSGPGNMFILPASRQDFIADDQQTNLFQQVFFR